MHGIVNFLFQDQLNNIQGIYTNIWHAFILKETIHRHMVLHILLSAFGFFTALSGIIAACIRMKFEIQQTIENQSNLNFIKTYIFQLNLKSDSFMNFVQNKPTIIIFDQ